MKIFDLIKSIQNKAIDRMSSARLTKLTRFENNWPAPLNYHNPLACFEKDRAASFQT